MALAPNEGSLDIQLSNWHVWCMRFWNHGKLIDFLNNKINKNKNKNIIIIKLMLIIIINIATDIITITRIIWWK